MFYFSRLWAKQLKKVQQVHAQVEGCFYVTYEELTQDEGKFTEVLKFIGAAPSDDFTNSVANLGIRGSGFYQGGKEQLSETSTTNWSEEKKTKDFNPVDRWKKHWTSLDKILYDLATLFTDKKHR